MANKTGIRPFLLLFALLYAVLLYFFYLKYVPLVTSFQLVLLPVLLAVFFLAATSPERGTLSFILFFPLINNLPYFFRIYENIPHAPTALTLFLFFFLGWLVHVSLSGKEISWNHPIFRPLFFLALTVVISAAITFFRYANFFPFVSDSFYELVINVNGVTAGGGFMSILFHSLNYLAGFAFFLVLFNTLKSEGLLKRASLALATGLLISLVFGLFQRLQGLHIGNTPFWVGMKQANATFKDPNALGAFLAMTIPLVLALTLALKAKFRIFGPAILILAAFLFPHAGTRSALLGLAAGLLLLLALLIFFSKKTRKAPVFVILAILILSVLGAFSLSQSRLSERLRGNTKTFSGAEKWLGVSPERFFLWKEALQMTKDFPVAGVGVGAYIIELSNYYAQDKTQYHPWLESFRRIDSAENYFLHVTAEMGLVGLVFSLWAWGVILVQVRKGLLSADKEGQQKYFLAGASAGLAAYFVNILFHSYIGSFEVKYAFWLLVALALASCRQPSVGEAKKPKPLANAVSLSLILVFGASHLWNSTHALFLFNRTESLGIKQEFGFYPREKTGDGQEFRWTKKNAALTLAVEKPVIHLPLLASHPDLARNPVRVEIFLAKGLFRKMQKLAEVILTRGEWQDFRFSLPEGAGREVILVFRVSRTWNPQKILGTPDPRNLGIAVGRIIFENGLP